MTGSVRPNVSKALEGAWLVALVALVFSSVLVVRSLSETDWDPTLFTAFGEEALPTRVYAEERLGDVFLRASQGHDGKFFVQANDPLVLDPETNASCSIGRSIEASECSTRCWLVAGVCFHLQRSSGLSSW